MADEGANGSDAYQSSQRRHAKMAFSQPTLSPPFVMPLPRFSYLVMEGGEDGPPPAAQLASRVHDPILWQRRRRAAMLLRVSTAVPVCCRGSGRCR